MVCFLPVEYGVFWINQPNANHIYSKDIALL